MKKWAVETFLIAKENVCKSHPRSKFSSKTPNSKRRVKTRYEEFTYILLKHRGVMKFIQEQDEKVLQFDMDIGMLVQITKFQYFDLTTEMRNRVKNNGFSRLHLIIMSSSWGKKQRELNDLYRPGVCLLAHVPW